MEVTEVLKSVAVIITFVYSVIMTVVTIINRNKNKSTQVEKEPKTDFLTILNNNIVKYMSGAEVFFKGITSVGTKTGTLKEEQVIDKIKVDCLQNGVEFDEQLTKDKIKEIVDFKNI